ncbi:hypothetical protein DL98DRAFT_512482 [Cadophora sp. DSE1049]|nr:hypothetical protein DL98DRAFT_512482 [Cadophora sp. DSE1049]
MSCRQAMMMSILLPASVPNASHYHHSTHTTTSSLCCKRLATLEISLVPQAGSTLRHYEDVTFLTVFHPLANCSEQILVTGWRSREVGDSFIDGTRYLRMNAS